MTKKFFTLLLLFLGSLVSLRAELVQDQPTERHLIYKIMKNHECCVSAFEGDKIFIHPGNIIATDQGLFLNLNGMEYARLPLLQLNRQGYFIESSVTQYRELAAVTRGPCPECGVNTSIAGICQNPKCEFYKIKVIYWP